MDGIISFTFIVGAALAGLGGILYGFAYPQINVFMGIMPGLKAFIAAVLGGIGNVPGAVIGGLIVSTFATLTILPSIYAILQANASVRSPSLNPMDPLSEYYDGVGTTSAEGSN